jgi:EAL domain-containing protein (putative c-di-GMP-specific phosphodiesterase class I)
MAEAALAELALESRLALAVRQQEFVLHFQPQLALAPAAGTGGGAAAREGHRLIAVEALVRWAHPQRGLMAPDEFIPLAEARRLILPIGAWVLKEALGAAMRWRAHAAGARIGAAPVAVNLSALQFQVAGFADLVAEALAETGAEGSMLELELNERMLMADVGEVRATLARLREMGVTITVDDFGTGYSSLAHLKDLPLHRLKIDRSFVAGLPGDSGAMAISRAIVQMGQGLGLQVVAEGVETEAQREALLAMGCTVQQGHLFARPMPEPQWLQWVRGRAGPGA